MRVYPVIHINEEPAVARQQADKAFDAGADGVYLIDHISSEPDILFDTFNEVTNDHPSEYVGVNMLGFRPSEALIRIQRALEDGELGRAPDGLWTDDIRSDPHLGDAQTIKEYFEQLRKVRILGGVAFKYTRSYTANPWMAKREAAELSPYVDIVTTSGAGTGKAPGVAKVRAMKRASGSLAVASGISVENIARYKNIVDEVLVASSVETEPYSGVFDEEKLRVFIQQAHDLGAKKKQQGASKLTD